MTTYLRRQISAICAQGQQEPIAAETLSPYRIFDVLPRNELVLQDGQWTQDSISIAATQSYTLPLPQNYNSATQKLHLTIRSNAICKAAVTTTLGTQTFLIKGTNDAASGDHKGVVILQDNVTGVTLSVPATFGTALIDYCLWVIPDLTKAASFRNGNLVFGFVTGT